MSSCRNSVCRSLPGVEFLKFCLLEVTQFQVLESLSTGCFQLHIPEIFSIGGCYPLSCKKLPLRGYLGSNDETNRDYPVPGVETPSAGG